ncbi:MAG: DUF1365 domain-containing protein [Alphaproteobacteria bacterium]
MAVKTAPQILTATVMHKRTYPKVNAFTYGIYYLWMPLSQLERFSDGWRFGVNARGLLSFYNKDHGPRDGSALQPWIRAHLQDWGVTTADGEIILVTMPRSFGHVFNPVSFWLCCDVAGAVRAILCEVHNTFGEMHSYLCAHADGREIVSDDWLEARKVFHVSPFLERHGSYKFRFALQPEKFGAWIDFYEPDGRRQLLTSLVGTLCDYNRPARQRAFWRHPAVALVALWRIHWQALKLVAKGIKYIPKPLQNKEKITAVDNLTKK